MIVPWDHQVYGVDSVLAAIARDVRRILLTSPTGMGKSWMVCEIIDRLVSQDWQAVLYSNRILLVEQLQRVLTAHGIEYGMRASGKEGGEFQPVQISSLPTERSRVLKKQSWRIHGEGHKCLAIVDEAHLNAGPTAQKMFKLHEQAGHFLLGVTATPLGLGGTYDELIQAGKVSDGRACGALVFAHHYGPDEPDLKKVCKVTVGEDLSENENRKAMGEAGSKKAQQLFGRIIDWREQLNPQGKPGMLFGSGVPESLWLAEQLFAAGIPAAHIDGADTWINGSFFRSDEGARQAVREGSKSGDIKVVCNRFVLREGIDWPWIEHIILATVINDVKTFLQIVGRGLRAAPGKDGLILQDHGGAWWRCGSANEDREWRLEQTSTIYQGLREDGMRNGDPETPEPMRCPQCAKILRSYRCKACGWEAAKGSRKSRPVIQADGSLREMVGNIFRPHRINQRPDGPELWKRMYYRSKTGKGQKRTFRAAAALYAAENNWGWPDPNWPYMPKHPEDYYRRVADVPPERLRA